MMLDYAIMIEPLSKADGGGYLTSVPALPGCMSDGETPEEALINIQDAIAGWIDAAREWNTPVPRETPRTRAG